jgi:fibro-slime domain-containing protein
MKLFDGTAANSRGIILFITMLIVLSLAGIGIAMITNAYLNATVSKNYRSRLQSFYASDGQMTLLCQEMIDSNYCKYIACAGGAGGGQNLFANPGFTNGLTGWTTEFTSPAASSFSASGGMAVIAINTAGTADWHTRIFQTITLDGGTYSMSFEVKKHTAGAKNVMLVIEQNSSPYTRYVSQQFTIDGTWNKCTVSATMPANTSCRFGVYGGQDDIDFDIQNAILTSTTCSGPSGTKATISAISASSVKGGATNTANLAIDNNTSTRWESEWSDPQWLMADLGSVKNLSMVYIDWEDASANTYKIQGSNDQSAWTDLRSITNATTGNHRIDSIKCLSGGFRYVRMYGTVRNRTVYGYSIFEFNVFADTGTGQVTGRDTSTIGSFNVDWQIVPAGNMAFNLTTTSFLPNASAKNAFRTPLTQYLELSGGGLVNPYGDTVAVPVRFYDYHSDRTNPEFEQPSSGLPNGHKGMVGATLDSDRKPVLGPNPWWNYYIKYWFRPWQDLAQYGGQIPRYRYNENKGQPTATTYIWSDGYMKEWGEGSWAGVVPGDTGSAYGKVNADSAFRNIVIDTTLKFWHIGGGTYRYEWPNDRYSPLDNKGFGNEYNYSHQCLPEYSNSDHNYSYTMEMKRSFTKTSGLRFNFSGDDDVWLFINNTLVMDLGGRHPILADTVYVDDLGLQDKTVYNFDFFYCERHSPGSNIHIETNMLVYVPMTTDKRRWKRDYGKID